MTTARLLLAQGAEISAKDFEGKTPRNLALDWEQDEMAKWLLQRGASQ